MKNSLLTGILIIFFHTSFSFNYDLTVLDAGMLKYVTTGQYIMRCTFRNVGSTTINYFSANFKIDNGATVTSSISTYDLYPYTIAGVRNRFTNTTPVNFTQTGVHTLKIWLSGLNGNADQDHSNDTLVITVHVYSYLPQKNMLLEYMTHTTCGPCGQTGGPDFETITDSFPNNVVGVSVHHANGVDPYNTNDGTLIDWNFYVFAHPWFLYDRFNFAYMDTFNIPAFISYYYPERPASERLEYREPIDVNVIVDSYDAVTRILNLTVTGQFYDNYIDDLRLNATIVEDSIIGYQAGAVNSNNYAHRYVLRSCLGTPFGTAGSVPLQNIPGSSVSQSYSYVIPAGYNENNIYIIGAMQRWDSTDTYHRDIVNVKRVRLMDALTGINSVSENNTSVTVYPSPAKDMLYLELNKFNNGCSVFITDMFGKTVHDLRLNSGDSKISYSIDVRHLAAGIYSCTITDGTSIIVKRFVKK